MYWSVEGDVTAKRSLRASGWWCAPEDRLPDPILNVTRYERVLLPAPLTSDDLRSRSPPAFRRRFTSITLPRLWLAVAPLFYTLVLCILLSACEKPPPIRIGLMPWPGYQVFHLAEEKAFFKAEGANVQLLTFASLGDTRRAFERGQIDAMCCTIVEVLAVHEHSDRKPRVAWIIDSSDGDDVIIARAPISRVDELRNHVIGVEPATSHSVLLIHALQKAGLSLNDVRLRPMAVTNLSTAFVRGEIDAAAAYRPFSLELLRQPGAKVIFSSKETPNEFFDVLAVGTSVLEKRRSDIIAATRALDRALQYTKAQPEEALSIMAKFQGVSLEEFKADFEDVRLIGEKKQEEFFASGGPLLQAISKTADGLRATGQIRGQVTPEALTADLFTPANTQ